MPSILGLHCYGLLCSGLQEDLDGSYVTPLRANFSGQV